MASSRSARASPSDTPLMVCTRFAPVFRTRNVTPCFNSLSFFVSKYTEDIFCCERGSLASFWSQESRSALLAKAGGTVSFNSTSVVMSDYQRSSCLSGSQDWKMPSAAKQSVCLERRPWDEAQHDMGGKLAKPVGSIL